MIRPDLTVCVPAWNCAAFIAETLDHIAAQQLRANLIISLDASDDGSEEVIRRWVRSRGLGPSTTLVVQPSRLGWVDNVNACIARVETEMFVVAPHDDLLRPDALRRCVEVLDEFPDAVCAHGDLVTFGHVVDVVSAQSVTGTRLERLECVVADRFPAVHFRGVIRRRHRWDRPLVPRDVMGDYAADAVWLARLAGRGSVRRIPEVLVDKYVGPDTAHAEWSTWPDEVVTAAWTSHCCSILKTALAYARSRREREILIAAAVLRHQRGAELAGLRVEGGATSEDAPVFVEPSRLGVLVDKCQMRLDESRVARSLRRGVAPGRPTPANQSARRFSRSAN